MIIMIIIVTKDINCIILLLTKTDDDGVLNVISNEKDDITNDKLSGTEAQLHYKTQLQ